jgi:hypothetical protein
MSRKQIKFSLYRRSLDEFCNFIYIMVLEHVTVNVYHLKKETLKNVNNMFRILTSIKNN